MKTPAFLFVLFFLQLSCSQIRSKPITEVSQSELKTGILVDVRTPEEYGGGHLEGAVNINWFSENFVSEVAALPKGKILYLYCKKGGRSAKAAHVLDSLGYRVTDLTGGYAAWLAQKQ